MAKKKKVEHQPDEKHIYLLIGLVAFVAVFGVAFMAISNNNANLAGEAFYRGFQATNSKTPTYLGPPSTISEEPTVNGGQLSELTDPVKGCIRGAISEIKTGAQNCDPTSCIDACEERYPTDMSNLKICASKCSEDFKSCTNGYRSDFNDAIRNCATEYAPDPINQCTEYCDGTTTDVRTYSRCASDCVKLNWIEPARACVDHCRTKISTPESQEEATAMKEQFRVCSNDCLVDFDQYLE